MILHVEITAYIEPKEAVKRIVNITTIIADLAFLLQRLLTLLQMLNMAPSGTHSDNTTAITSIRSMVVPMWLQSKESHTLSLWGNVIKNIISCLSST